MNHLSTSIERHKQTTAKLAKRPPQLVDSQINAIVLAYQRIKKLSQRIKENEMTMQLAEDQIRFMDLFESQCDQLKIEVTSTEFTTFELRYLEIPRKQKTYVEIAPLTGYEYESTPRKIVNRLRSKFLKQLVESGLEALYLKEIEPQSQLPELSASDLLQAYETIKKTLSTETVDRNLRKDASKFLHLVELVLERLSEETTEGEYSAFELYYLETPRKRKNTKQLRFPKIILMKVAPEKQ